MTLQDLQLDRTPGRIAHRRVTFKPGLNLLVGPNGSGKSTIGRAIGELLWPSDDPTWDLRSTWQVGGSEHEIALRAGHVTGRRNLSSELRSGWWLRLAELVGSPGSDPIATAVQRQLHGGLDLDAARPKTRQPKAPSRKPLLAARKAQQDALARADKLGRQQAQLGAWEAQAELGAARKALLAQMDTALRDADRRAELEAVERELTEFSVFAHLAVAQVRELDRALGQRDQALAMLQQRAEDLLVHPKPEPLPFDDADLTRASDDRQQLDTLMRDLGDAERERSEAAARAEETLKQLRPAATEITPELFDAMEELATALQDADLRAEIWQRLTDALPERTAEAGAFQTAHGKALEFNAPAAIRPGFVFLLLAGGGYFLHPTLGAALAGAGLALIGVASLSKSPWPAIQEEIRAWNERSIQAEIGAFAWQLRARSRDAVARAQSERARVADQAAEAGFAPDLIAHRPLRRARALFDTNQARRDLVALQARVRHLHEETAILRTHAAEAYPWAQPLGAPAIAAARERLLAWRQAQQAHDLVLREHHAAEQTAADTAQALQSLQEQLQVPAGVYLPTEQLLDALQRRSELRAGAAVLPESLLCPREELEVLRLSWEDEAAQGEHARTELHRVRAEIRQAERSTSLSDAIAEEAHAQAAYDQKLRENSETIARHLLLDFLAHEHNEGELPALLQGAKARFLQFTRGRYSLMVRDRSWRALDHHDGIERPLEALSDATRIQLLLAARLAWIDHHHQGEPLPLFLDEVLSTSDPLRFEAVAGALLQLVEEGRQVIYATADTAELARWTALAPTAHVIELGSLPAWDMDLPPSMDTSRGSDDAAAWSARLGLPRPSLHDAIDSWPLPLALADDLDRVEPLVARGLLTVGAALRGPSDPSVNDRARALQGALDRLREGRPEPIPWERLVHHDAVTKRWHDDIRSAWERCQGEAQAFLGELDNLKRFPKKKREELHMLLQEGGWLDTRPARTAADPLERQVAWVVGLGTGTPTS